MSYFEILEVNVTKGIISSLWDPKETNNTKGWKLLPLKMWRLPNLELFNNRIIYHSLGNQRPDNPSSDYCK